MMTVNFPIFNGCIFYDLFREITGKLVFSEYSGISLILSIERVSPGTFERNTPIRESNCNKKFQGQSYDLIS